MRFTACSIALWVSVSLLGLGARDAEAGQHYRRSVRSTRGYAPGTTRSYTGGVTRSYRGSYRGHYRPHGGAYRGHYYGGYRSFYRPHYRYGGYYGYRPYYPAYYRPSFNLGWGWPGWGYGPSVGFGVGYSPRVQVYSGGPTDYSSHTGAVRTQVNLKQTEVWLDGYYSGTVDDFDGSYQRLYMPPGEHEILLRLDGYRTYREVIQISPGRTLKLQHEMEPLGPGESTAPPPEPRRSAPTVDAFFQGCTTTATRVLRHHGRNRRNHPALRSPPPPAQGTTKSIKDPEPKQGARAISLRYAVFTRAAHRCRGLHRRGALGLTGGFRGAPIHLPVGRHRIGIRGRGFESFDTEVEIRTGEATPLHVKLDGDRRL